MKTSHRKPLLGLIALGAAFSAPAFAQQAQHHAQDAAVQEQQHLQAQSAAAADAQPQAADPSGQSQQGWNSLDTDKDGAISKVESSANPGLSQIFGQAGGDSDGTLTQEEYKAFVVKHYGGGAGQASGQ